MADRIVVMRGGHVEQIGAPLELYDRPANLFVAGFIGSPAMNLIAGEIRDGGFHVGDVVLPLPWQPGGFTGPAIYGIRPEHMQLDSTGTSAEVRLVEPMGSETQITLNLGGRDVIGAFRDRIPAQVGDVLGIGIESARAHLFDPESGDRLRGE